MNEIGHFTTIKRKYNSNKSERISRWGQAKKNNNTHTNDSSSEYYSHLLDRPSKLLTIIIVRCIDL